MACHLPDTSRKVLLVFTCFIGQFVSMGLFYSYGQFFAALKVETGESGGKLALIGSTRDFLISLFTALGGYFAKSFGFVNLAILGSALVVLSLILDGILPSTSWLFLSFSLMSGSGCGLLFVPSCMVLYKELSGRMLPIAVGIGAAGGSVGTMVLNLVLEHLTEAWGWRYARQVLAAALLILLTMNTLALWCCLVEKKMQNEADQESDSQGESSEGSERSDSLHLKLSGQHAKELVRPFASPSFALLSIGLILYNIGFTVPYTHLVFFAQLHDYEEGEMLISIMGAASLVGRILCGLGAVVVSPRLLLVLVITIQGCSLIWLPTCDTELELISFSVLFGGSSGARVAVLSLVIWEMFGAENVSHYYGLASGVGGIGVAIGPALVGVIFDATGSYGTAFLTAAFFVFASLPFILASFWSALQEHEMRKVDSTAVAAEEL